MNLTRAEAKRLGLEVGAVSAAHSQKVKADKSHGSIICEGLVEAVFHLTGIRGRTEFQFHVARKWRLDVAYPTHLVALELNGWKSHHRRGRMEEDNVKLSAAIRMGWRVFYATAAQVKHNAALWLAEALNTPSCPPDRIEE